MSETKTRLLVGIKEAMIERNKNKLTALRLLNDAIQKEEKALRRDLEEAEVYQVIHKQLNVIKEEIKDFTEAGRTDRVETLNEALKAVEFYAPEQLTEAEMVEIIWKAVEGLKAEGNEVNIKTLMPLVQAQTKGRADGKHVSQLVRQRLE